MRIIFFLALSLALFAGCKSDKANSSTETQGSTTAAEQVPMDKTALAAKIGELRNQIYNQKSNSFDKKVAAQYVNYCEQYATVAPDDPQAVQFLFQAGETARSIQAYDKALAIYDNIYNKFSSNPKAAQALFLKAFTLDNDMNQPEKARSIYTDFMTKYPNDEFADDTKFLLENLGKSDEEIIKRFEQ